MATAISPTTARWTRQIFRRWPQTSAKRFRRHPLPRRKALPRLHLQPRALHCSAPPAFSPQTVFPPFSPRRRRTGGGEVRMVERPSAGRMRVGLNSEELAAASGAAAELCVVARDGGGSVLPKFAASAEKSAVSTVPS